MGTIAFAVKAATGVLLLRPPQPERRSEMKNIDISKLPELGTRVGIHGSARQQEVGGAYCAGVVIIITSG